MDNRNKEGDPTNNGTNNTKLNNPTNKTNNNPIEYNKPIQINGQTKQKPNQTKQNESNN